MMVMNAIDSVLAPTVSVSMGTTIGQNVAKNSRVDAPDTTRTTPVIPIPINTMAAITTPMMMVVTIGVRVGSVVGPKVERQNMPMEIEVASNKIKVVDRGIVVVSNSAAGILPSKKKNNKANKANPNGTAMVTIEVHPSGGVNTDRFAKVYTITTAKVNIIAINVESIPYPSTSDNTLSVGI